MRFMWVFVNRRALDRIRFNDELFAVGRREMQQQISRLDWLINWAHFQGRSHKFVLRV